MLALDDNPSSELDVDKPTEDDGGVEDQSEGPEGDPERHVIDTVILMSVSQYTLVGVSKRHQP